jgi:hypothetical protein
LFNANGENAMTIHESESLKIGDRVVWDGDSNDLGTVIDAGYSGVTITWDKGETGGIAHGGMTKITRAQTTEARTVRRPHEHMIGGH